MMRSLVPRAEEKASALGHVVRWDTIGENVAHGHCSRCRMLLGVAQSREGIGEEHGQALEHACPGSALTPPAAWTSPVAETP